MKIAEGLRGVTRLFLDSAPVIYEVEQNPHYSARTTPIFDLIDTGPLTAITSPLTLAECLVIPFRLGMTSLQQDFIELILHGNNTLFAPIDHACAQHAAELRARYTLGLLDALQVAVALNMGCEALLTNDAAFSRVPDLRILLLDELEL